MSAELADTRAWSPARPARAEPKRHVARVAFALRMALASAMGPQCGVFGQDRTPQHLRGWTADPPQSGEGRHDPGLSPAARSTAKVIADALSPPR